MKLTHNVLLLCAFAPSAFAQSADPADPKAVVPPTTYVSAMLPAVVATEEAPDKVWKQANEQVKGQGGHSGHGAGADAHAHAQHAAPTAPAASEHAHHAAPAPAAQQHTDHSQHTQHPKER